MPVNRNPGAAQRPLGQPWCPDPGGRRSVADAISLAKEWGVVVEDDVRIVVNDPWLNMLGDEVYAAYATFKSISTYTWDDMLIKGKMVVKLRLTVLDSDEGIIEVLAHEMHEINALREMFQARHRIPGAELIRLTEVGRQGNLHDRAWDVGATLVRRVRGGSK